MRSNIEGIVELALESPTRPVAGPPRSRCTGREESEVASGTNEAWQPLFPGRLVMAARRLKVALAKQRLR